MHCRRVPIRIHIAPFLTILLYIYIYTLCFETLLIIFQWNVKTDSVVRNTCFQWKLLLELLENSDCRDFRENCEIYLNIVKIFNEIYLFLEIWFARSLNEDIQLCVLNFAPTSYQDGACCSSQSAAKIQIGWMKD